MTDEEAYRQGKRIADDMVRSGRAIQIGGSSGDERARSGRPTNTRGVPASNDGLPVGITFVIVLVVMAAVVYWLVR